MENVHVPDRLAGIMYLIMLSQHHLGLVLQILHLFWILQASCLCKSNDKVVGND